MVGTPNQDRFNQEAQGWDAVDRRVQLAHAVAGAIAARVPLDGEMRMLDLGCGTGLVTLALAPRVGEATGADTAEGMLAVLAEKAALRQIPVRTLLLAEDGSTPLGGPYDLITSSMALHHVADVPALLARLRGALAPGGWIALADLDAEDGSFHEDPAGVFHRGFPRAQMQAWLQAAGFQDVAVEEAATTHKGSRDYTVFLAVGRG